MEPLLDEIHVHILEYIVNGGGKCYTPEFGKSKDISSSEFDSHAGDLVKWGYLSVKEWKKHKIVFKDYYWTGKL